MYWMLRDTFGTLGIGWRVFEVSQLTAYITHNMRRGGRPPGAPPRAAAGGPMVSVAQRRALLHAHSLAGAGRCWEMTGQHGAPRI